MDLRAGEWERLRRKSGGRVVLPGAARWGPATDGGRAKRCEKLGGAGVRAWNAARKTTMMEEERSAPESPEVSDAGLID